MQTFTLIGTILLRIKKKSLKDSTNLFWTIWEGTNLSCYFWASGVLPRCFWHLKKNFFKYSTINKFKSFCGFEHFYVWYSTFFWAQTIVKIDKHVVFFTESAHWADLVIELQCPSVCLWGLETPSSWGRGDLWLKNVVLILGCDDTVFKKKIYC